MLRFLTATIMLCATLGVGDALAQGSAGQAGEFLRWGIGAKALGMGRAFTSIADDASAMYWNPAGMTALPRIGGTMMFMHLPLREGASVNYLAGAIPMRLFFTRSKNPGRFIRGVQDLKFGLGVVWHSLGDFQFFDDTANKIGSDNGTIGESAVYLSASYPLNFVFRGIKPHSRFGWVRFLRGNLELGLTTKFVRQDLFGENGSATSFDFGLKYSHISGLFNAGFVLRDVNSATISYGEQFVGDQIPRNGVVGVSFVPPIGRLHGLLLSLDYGIVAPDGRDSDVMFGLEYDFSVIDARLPVRLRLGSNSNQESFTFGLHFSPEALWNQDWAPSADWTYASERSRFDAVGARYSFSVDRNPFTARYWYAAAMSLFPQESCLDKNLLHDAGEISRSLSNAMDAKNPGKRAFRYEAALRSADISFLQELQALQNSKQADDFSPDDAINRFTDVTRLYDGRGHRYLVMDYGKLEFDREQYLRSLLYFVQSLVLAGKQELAVAISAERGRTWGRRFAGFVSADSTQRSEQQAFDYLRAYSLYADGREDDALEIINKHLDQLNLGRFLRSHIHFLRRQYAATLRSLDDLDLNFAGFPKYLHLPITSDCSFGDEVLFLRAASMYQLSDPEFVNEFARIPRFFPNSDLAKFMTNGNAILKRLLEYQENGQHDQVHQLVSKMVESYLKTFSNGTLIEELYTMNYR